MSMQYNDALGAPWITTCRSMRPRDALKHIAAQLDGIEALTDLDKVRIRLAIIHEKTELGLAYQAQTRRSHTTELPRQ